MDNEAKQNNLNNDKKTDFSHLEEESKKTNYSDSNNLIESVSDVISIAKYCLNTENWETKHQSTKNGFTQFGIWFRGEKDKTDKECQENLTPGIFRDKNLIELSLVRHFQTRFPSYRNEIKSIFEWLCLMQHYHASTRLLDWTENILFALFFALYREPDDNNNDRLLFVLRSWFLNDYSNTMYLQEPGCINQEKRIQTPFNFNAILRANMAISQGLSDLFFNDEVNQSKFDLEFPPKELWKELCNRYQNTIYKPSNDPSIDSHDPNMDYYVKKFLKQIRKPVAVFPYRNNPRLHVQQGAFTIHGGKNKNELISDEYEIGEPFQFNNFTHKELKDFMKVYRIKGDKVDNLIQELNLLGINEGLLFPELDYQSKYLENIWKISR